MHNFIYRKGDEIHEGLDLPMEFAVPRRRPRPDTAAFWGQGGVHMTRPEVLFSTV